MALSGVLPRTRSPVFAGTRIDLGHPMPPARPTDLAAVRGVQTQSLPGDPTIGFRPTPGIGRFQRREAPVAPAPMLITPEPVAAPRAPAAPSSAPGGLGGLGGFGDTLEAVGYSMMTGGHGNLFGNFPQAMEGIRSRREAEAEKARAEQERAMQAQGLRALGREMGFSDEEIAAYGNDPAFIKAAYELREKKREQAERTAWSDRFAQTMGGTTGQGESVPLGDFSAYEDGGAQTAQPGAPAAPASAAQPAPPAEEGNSTVNALRRQREELQSMLLSAPDTETRRRVEDALAINEERMKQFGAAAGEERGGLQPVFVEMPDGNIVPYQVTDAGNFRRLQQDLPEGARILSGVLTVDDGTGTQLRDRRSGAPIDRVETDITGRETATVVGRAQGESIANAPGAIRTAETVIGVIDNVLGQPGREAATGFSRIYSVPFGYAWSGSPEKNFEVAREQLEGQAFLQAFESLKGGGPITDIEGQQATRASARLDPNQSDEEFVRSLQEMRDIALLAKQRAERLLRGETVTLPDGRVLVPDGTSQGREMPGSTSPQTNGPRIISVEPMEPTQ